MKIFLIGIILLLSFSVNRAYGERDTLHLQCQSVSDSLSEEAEEWPEEIPDYEAPSCSEEQAVFESAEQHLEFMMRQPIIKETEIYDADRLYRFVSRHNPDFDKSIAEAYVSVGLRYGIPGDIALCQGIVETGWFRFNGGTKVTPDQHNYCGLGVLKLGQRGHSFNSVEDGVTAQIQHLYAYACDSPLPEGEQLLDPRFNLVKRGIAPTWEELSGRWAANSRYARSILKLYIELKKFE